MNYLFDISELEIAEALKQVKITGRLQVCYKQCEIIADVAHNPDAALWLAKKIQSMPNKSKTYASVGICKDKDWQGIIQPFLDVVDYWYTVQMDNSRMLEAEHLAMKIKNLTKNPVVSCGNIQETINYFK